MFNWRKNIPSDHQARDALILAFEDLSQAHQYVKEAEARIARLRSVIEAAETVQREFHQVVAGNGGADSLARFAAGDDRDGMGAMISISDHATRAAAVARDALPAAECALVDARNEVAKCEVEKRRRIAGVLIEHGNVLGERYKACFDELCKVHDELVAFVEGARLPDVQLVNTLLEVPRFNLPAMRITVGALEDRGYSLHGLNAAGPETYSPYLKQRQDRDQIAAKRSIWARFVAALSSDPEAQPGALPKGKSIAPPPLVPALIIHKRERDEPTVNEVLYGS